MTVETLYVGSDGPISAHGDRRLAALPDALTASPVDVLCLQGVGAHADRAALRAALTGTYPWSLDLETDDSTTPDDPRDASGATPPADTKPPCASLVDVVAAPLRCLSGCLDSTTRRLADPNCLLPVEDPQGCLDPAFLAGDPERRCAGCVEAHLLSGAPVEEATKRCTSIAHPVVANGAHGMVLLSKLPLARPSLVVLPAEVARRAIVGATVTTPGGREVDVVCANLGPVGESGLPLDPRTADPYPGPYGGPTDGWARENELQVERLIAHVESRRQGRPAIVLGNFGASVAETRAGGVALPGVGANAAHRLDAAFASGVAADYVPSCTVCLDNPLVPWDAMPSFTNRVYLAGLPTTAARASTRTYLGRFVVGDEYRGVIRVLPLAVQYGFRSTIQVSP